MQVHWTLRPGPYDSPRTLSVATFLGTGVWIMELVEVIDDGSPSSISMGARREDSDHQPHYSRTADEVRTTVMRRIL